jgi:hypothetical protein
LSGIALRSRHSNLATPKGLVLIVEDLHRSGAVTLDASGLLARRLRGDAVMLVGTYRDNQKATSVAATTGRSQPGLDLLRQRHHTSSDWRVDEDAQGHGEYQHQIAL